jgi:hypothetical protein
MAGPFQTLLEEIVANPHQKLSELPLFTAADKTLVIGGMEQQKFRPD